MDYNKLLRGLKERLCESEQQIRDLLALQPVTLSVEGSEVSLLVGGEVVDTFDICQIIDDNCPHPSVTSEDSTVQVVYDGSTYTYDLSVELPPDIIVTTDLNSLGVTQSGVHGAVINVTLLSVEAGNILTTGGDGGLLLTCETVAGCISLTSEDTTISVEEVSPGVWNLETNHTIDTDTKLQGAFNDVTGEVCFSLVNSVTSAIITPDVFCFTVPTTGHSVVTGTGNSCIDVQVTPTVNPDGTIVYDVQVLPIISTDIGNTLECRPNGLYSEETALVVTTEGTALGVTQTGDVDHTVDITLLSKDANQLAQLGSDGGVLITCADIEGCITLESSDSTVTIVETSPGVWDLVTTPTVDTDTRLQGQFNSTTGQVCFDLVNTVTLTTITENIFCFTVPQTGHSVVLGLDTNCISLSSVATVAPDGTITYEVSANPIMSALPLNSITCEDDGLYVKQCPSGAQSAWFQDTTTIPAGLPRLVVHNTATISANYSVSLIGETLTGTLGIGASTVLVPQDEQSAFQITTLSIDYGNGCTETILVPPFNCCNLPPKIFDVLGCTVEELEFTGIADPEDFSFTGDIVSYEVTTDTVDGVFTITDPLTGAFTFLPNADFVGTACVTITATNEPGLTDTAEYCIKVLAPPVSECVKILEYTENGQLLLEGSPILEKGVDDGTYETTLQYSLDGNTWLNPTSYAGSGELWIPLNSGDPSFAFAFTNVDLSNGGYVRNCVRVIGEPLSYCDVKQLPTAVVNFDGSTITFSNTPDTSNECFVGETILITVRAFDDAWNLIETWVSPKYDPSVDMPDLSGLPAGLATILTADTNTSLAYDGTQLLFPHIEVDMAATHEYSCENCSTTLSAATTDLTDYLISASVICEECAAIDAILDGATITIADPNSIVTNPAHGGNVIYSIYDSLGNLQVEFANGSLYDPTLGHFPMNSGTTYPLQGGDYYSVVTTPTCVTPCDYFTVEVGDICEGSVQMNYNGIATGSENSYQLAVNPSMTEIEYSFVTQTIPDQFIVRYEGVIIFDSGQISTGTTPQTGAIPFVYNSDSFIEVEVVPDPTQPPLTVTIYSLSVGCCLLGDPVTLPNRDPFLTSDFATFNSCGFNNVWFKFPYILDYAANPTGLPPSTPLNDIGVTGCVISPNDVINQAVGISYGCGIGSTFFDGCMNATSTSPLGFNSLPNETNITETIAGQQLVVTFTANQAANYAAAKAYLSELVALTSTVPDLTNGTYFLFLLNNKDVNCPSDGLSIPTRSLIVNSSMYVFNDATNTIIINNTIDRTGTGTCCYDSFIDSRFSDSSFANGYLGLFNNIGSTGRIQVLRPTIGTGGFSVNNGIACMSFDSGIISTPYTHTNPVSQYSVTFDVTDPQNTLTLREGDCDGTIISTLTDGDMPTLSGRVVIENTDGLIVQEINYGTATFDLTYYAGGQFETFVDGEALRARMEVLTGQSWDYIPHYDVLVRVSGSGVLQNITVTNP